MSGTSPKPNSGCRNDQVVPWYNEQGVPLLPILTDRGTEYCGNREQHEYQLYRAIENIDDSKTKAKSPQSNGSCERFHRTMKDECYSVAFRKKISRDVGRAAIGRRCLDRGVQQEAPPFR